MNMILGQLRRYWKQLSLVGVLISVTIIGFTVALAAPTVVVSTADENPVAADEWTVGHFETWTAAIAGVDTFDASDISWVSSDPNVIFVGNNTGSLCEIRATGSGKATVTVTYTYTDTSGNIQTAIAKKEFSVQLEITSVLSDNFIYLENPGDTFTVFTNYNSADNKLIWESENTDVATVAWSTANTATVTAQSGGGSSIIKVSTPDKDQFATIYVITRVKFNDYTLLEVGPNEYLNVFEDDETGLITSNATKLERVKFSSGDTRYFVTDDTGYIKGINAGIKSLFIYPNFDFSDTPYASYTEAQLAAKFGDAKSVRVNFGISNGDVTAAVGDKILMKVNATDADASGVNWTSSDTSIATISTDGIVTAKRSGVVSITATLDSSSLFPGERIHTATVQVTIVDSFSLNTTEAIINVEDTFDLTALVTDETASVSWMSSDETIASFEELEDDPFTIRITGNKKGIATITAIQEVNGVLKYAYCEINVSEPVQSITLYPTDLEINKGAQYPLVLTFTPSKPDNMEVLWVSSDESILTVSDTGVITGVGGGDATISVITIDGIKVASCKVHVRVPVTNVQLSVNSVVTSMSMENYQLSYTITPEGDGVDTRVTWSSSNQNVLTVNQNGFVTFVNPGKATVICQTIDTGTDGTNLIDTCEFFINEPVVSVTTDYTDVTLKIGESFRLTAEVLPENATDKTVTWISSNEAVVTVDSTGMLKAVGSGSAAILVQSNDSGVTSLCNVTVYQPVETVTLSSSSMSVRRGTIFWLNATVGPENAYNKAVTWTSSDTTIATVDSTGMVTTVSPGDCVITATSLDTGVYASCKVTVLEPVTGIELNYEEYDLYAGDKFLIIPTVSPVDADNKSVTYVSSDPSVAAVDSNGVVTGLKGGSAIILVTTVERGLIASCKVTVYQFVSSVEILDKTDKYINGGATRALTAEVLPDTATNRGVVWSSSNNNILTVDSKGVVRAVGYGRATITAKAADGSGVFDTYTLTSLKPVTDIEVEPSYVTLREGASEKITATIIPSDATIKDIDWSSSDPSIAAVDFDGEITAVKAGICYVYATSTDGNGIVGKVKVTVKPSVPATAVIINASSYTLLPGQSRALTYRLKPSTSTDTVKWVSSDPSVITVSSTGVVTAVGQGNAVIYCVTTSGVESECEIIVLSLNSSNITVEQYDTYVLDVFGATGTINWYTNNARIATVDKNGNVTGRTTGTTTIMAKVDGKVLYCIVNVTKIAK